MRRSGTRAELFRVVVALLAAAICGIGATDHAWSAGERIEADVSARTLSITSSFVGTEIVIFGSVENSDQPSAEAGTYDIIVVVEGVLTPTIVRRKSNIAGLWINSQQVRFASMPSFYAMATTRPSSEIAETEFFDKNEIGFSHVRIVQAPTGRLGETSAEEFNEFRDAVVRLKQRDGLYVKSDYGVAFVGRSLFRSTFTVPPNVPVGTLKTRVYLLRQGELLDTFDGEVLLKREGAERFLHAAAYDNPGMYGLVTLLLAMSAGLVSAIVFQKRR